MATVVDVLEKVNFAPALNALLGVVAAGIAFFIAVGAGVMVLKILRQVMGLPPMDFSKGFQNSSGGRNRDRRSPVVKTQAVTDWKTPCTTNDCKAALKFFEDTKRRDQKYREEDSRAVYEYHKRENARFGIEI